MHNQIHYRYWIGILLFLLIMALVVKWGDIENLTAYINFASTLASLLLAVLAILYSFYSNNSLSESVANLRNAANSVETKTSELNRSLQGFHTLVSEIPSSLKKMEGTLHETQGMIKASAMQPTTDTKPLDNVRAVAGAITGHFLTTASWNGLRLTYGFCLALDRKKEVNLRAFVKTLGETLTYDYAYGFTVALISTAMIDGKIQDGKISLLHALPELKSKIKQRLNVLAEIGTYGGSDLMKKQIAQVETFIESTS